MSVPGDNPITEPSEDRLKRTTLAQQFADQVLRLDASEGLVVGVLGPWGSGKTSFLNLARQQFRAQQVVTVSFNPWMFSGAEQLVDAFFGEIAGELRIKSKNLKSIAEGLETYGEAVAGLGWLPGIGASLERMRLVTRGTGKILKRRGDRTATQQRDEVREKLSELKRPIVVVLDDIDRLTPPEVRDIFRLVRLTASFPNVVYLLAFDRPRVEAALEEENFSGREYLEKILFMAVDLPPVPDQVMIEQITSALDAALGEVENAGPFDEGVWPDIFIEVIRPLVRNMRDVRRYIAAVDYSLRSLAGQVAVTDVLALEAVRIFRPSMFAELVLAVEGLTTTGGLSYGGHEPPALKESVETLVGADPESSDVAQRLVKRLFPGGERHIGGSNYGPDFEAIWLKERRVAHVHVLNMYLERLPNESMTAFTRAEQAFAVLGDEAALEAALRAGGPDQIEKSISALEAYESDFTAESVVPASTVLLNLLPEIPGRPRGMFDIDTRLVVGRVVYRLIRSLPGPAEVLAAVQEILPKLTTLSSKWDLITDVGHREGAGHKLVTEEAARELEEAFRQQVRSATPDELISEWDLLRVLYTTVDVDGDEPFELPDSPPLTRAVLRAGLTEVRSQSMESRSVTRTPRLHWDILVKLFGGEAALRSRFDGARADGSDEDQELFDLVERYLSGWRPKDFGGE